MYLLSIRSRASVPRWPDDHGPVRHDKLRGFDVSCGDGKPAMIRAVADPVRQALAIVVVVLALLRSVKSLR